MPFSPRPSRRAVIAAPVLLLTMPRDGAFAVDAPVLVARIRRDASGDVIAFGDNPLVPILRLEKGVDTPIVIANETTVPLDLRIRGLIDAAVPEPSVAHRVEPGGQSRLLLSPRQPGAVLLEAIPVTDQPVLARLAVFLPVLAAADDDRKELAFALVDRPAGDGAVAPRLVAEEPTPWPITIARAGHLKVRLANASPYFPVRVATMNLSGWIVGLDGQPTNEALTLDETGMVLAPRARADIILDAPAVSGRLVVDAGNGEQGLIELAAAAGGDDAAPVVPLPADASHLPATIDLASAMRVDLAIGAFVALGEVEAVRDRPVVISLSNPSERPAVVHLEGQVCRLLHLLDDGWEPYWRDTILLRAGDVQPIAFVPRAAGRWRMEAQSLGDQASPEVAFLIVT